ncbi:hypothetical protein [Sporosarcina sp. FSL K6-3457]|uniref:hypothetical protein n=1 Tax=Sporosarcina sp. FSL K6-3457 TaxID=2978204 RepID=UPI0030FCDD89
MKKVNLLLATCMLSNLLWGCSDNKQVIPEENTNIIEAKTKPESVEIINDNNKISFEDFRSLFNHMNKNLFVDGFKLKDSTVVPDLVVVDKDLTFNSREWLTLDGKLSENSKSTQETLFLENEDSSVLLTIILSYTGSYIGEDMIYYKIDSDYEINTQLANATDLVTISYKNLVISVLQTTNDKKDFDITQNTLKKIINILEKY